MDTRVSPAVVVVVLVLVAAILVGLYFIVFAPSQTQTESDAFRWSPRSGTTLTAGAWPSLTESGSYANAGHTPKLV